MKPCPKCGCSHQTLAYAIRDTGTTVCLSCMRCEYMGPEIPATFPPGRQNCAAAAEAWNALCRPGMGRVVPYVKPQYVKPARLAG